ncbi:SGNH/GDSL hydrolase family protein [Kitasatospora sp. NPDC006697]|uniref:SGNH/GDSL hydrolase family protein n=1 Tax=Kitasatospora sp. NPDC006697 TaxID=3364020 RepID=UPI003676819E
MTALTAGSTVLFQGDSVTDAARLEDADGLGYGYVRMAAERLTERHPGLRVVNRGIAGDRVADLRRRWTADTVQHGPRLVSVLVGINDTWRRYDNDDPTSTADFERDYRHLLTRTRDELGAELVLVEPFLLPVSADQWEWREDLDPRIHAVRRLAAEFGARLLAADGLLNQAARTAGGPELIALDGVHPTELGHRILADAWTSLVIGR